MKFNARTRPCLFMHSGIEEAANFYVELLPDSKIENIVRLACMLRELPEFSAFLATPDWLIVGKAWLRHGLRRIGRYGTREKAKNRQVTKCTLADDTKISSNSLRLGQKFRN